MPDEKLNWVTLEGREAICDERGVTQAGGAHLQRRQVSTESFGVGVETRAETQTPTNPREQPFRREREKKPSGLK